MSEKTEAAAARQGYVEALRVEREGYVRAGKTDRIKAVDAELARFDAAPEPDAKPARKATQTRRADKD